MKAQKEYKHQYKENVEKHRERTKSNNRLQQNGGSASKKNKGGANGDVDGDIWNCQRNNDDAQYLKGIPLDEKGKQNYLMSRKADFHYEQDFLPRSLVYNYGDFNFQDSTKEMEKALDDLNKGLGP